MATKNDAAIDLHGFNSLDEYLDPNRMPTMPIPDGGAVVGLGRITSYKAAKTGHLPTVQISPGRKVVPTAALRRMLGLDAVVVESREGSAT